MILARPVITSNSIRIQHNDVRLSMIAVLHMTILNCATVKRLPG
jgi:hypothetical protein